VEDDAQHLTAARESVAELVRFVRAAGVQAIFSCWFDDESAPPLRERTVTPDTLALPNFFFRERELLRIDLDG
jgi:hypothetical protein